MGDVRIVPTAEEHIDGFHRCVDLVARERRYLGPAAAPPPDASRAFVRSVVEDGGSSTASTTTC